MNRREFVRMTGAGVAAATALAEHVVEAQVARTPSPAKPGASSSVRMKVGTQHGDSDEILRQMAAFGCNNICSRLPSAKMDENWSVDSLKRLRDRVESFGITLDMVPLPLSSSPIARNENADILLAGPNRNKQIDDICQMIRNCAQAGIPHAKYNLTFIGVVRTESTQGRGPATRYSTFVYEGAKQDPPLTMAGKMDADLYWERITYFLERVVPVAEEYKVKIGCHPQDPGMPKGKGWQGVETVLGSVDGLKKFLSIKESPYHGLNFCQGTVSEMLEKPGEEIFDVIRYFGSRKKIFNVHFRNIEGRFLNFRESFIDNGSVDMLKAARVYKEVGYDGMLMPDHVPRVEGDQGAAQGFAFAIGYIKALIAAVSAET